MTFVTVTMLDEKHNKCDQLQSLSDESTSVEPSGVARYSSWLSR